jgi:hypothetical protein
MAANLAFPGKAVSGQSPCTASAATYQADQSDIYSDIAAWYARSGKQLVNLGSGKDGYPGLGVAFSPDGQRLATSHLGGVVRIWDFTALLRREAEK